MDVIVKKHTPNSKRWCVFFYVIINQFLWLIEWTKVIDQMIHMHPFRPESAILRLAVSFASAKNEGIRLR